MTGMIRKEVLDKPLFNDTAPVASDFSGYGMAYELPIFLKVKIAEKLIKANWQEGYAQSVENLMRRVAHTHDLTSQNVVLHRSKLALVRDIFLLTPDKAKIMVLEPSEECIGA